MNTSFIAGEKVQRKWGNILPLALAAVLVLSQPVLGQPKTYGPPPFDELVDSVKESVVNLSTTRVIQTSRLFDSENRLREFFGDEMFEKFFGQMPSELRTHALGSGFLIDREGRILTNNHVIENATEIKVTMQNQKVYDGVVVGRDPKTELALIKIVDDVELPRPAQLGDSDEIDVGDWVMAVGNPFGLGNTVTQGIISAKGRVIGGGNLSASYSDFLQTDAAINPGNSGGPLYNMSGQVVGINTAIVAQGQGIGFAIPINMAKDLLPQLKQGRVIRGWLGVAIQDVTPEMAEFFGLEEPRGVIIGQIIPGGPAEKAGLQQGDIVLSLNGQEIVDAQDLSRRVAELRPGQEVEFQIFRDGKSLPMTVALGEMPDETMEPEPQSPLMEEQTRFGFSVQDITGEIAEMLGISPEEKGVAIIEVEPGSPAAEAGLTAGDVIKQVNRRPVQNVREFQAAVRQRETKGLLLLLKRGEYSRFVIVQPLKNE
ncbi:MAG: Do family serine endopeptidase [Candidatus Abyssobacteria bacterium SURF_5]|uniref:Probable periplasmic serine endoprotease DegP-like n=1 Tax=Abyssobacteria bacterium (strain SURF_5) TaxID=2093360 RepID=A0A3A4N994_ABYX5|nr:MAG: Do family serine endopeptidase [Candidatus Abyssubacteria bacterium SURF_5]